MATIRGKLMFKIKASVVSSVIALARFAGLLCLGLSTPAVYYDIAYAGIGIFSVLAVLRYRRERRADRNTSVLGIWLIVAICILFVLLFLVLPALSSQNRIQ